MKPARLILFSGMGADARLFRSIRVAEVELVTPDYGEAEGDENLAHFASRFAEILDIQSADIVGGVSFGGMVAGEIARQRPVAGLILLGSCLHPDRLPSLYRWMERLGRFFPDLVLRLRSWRFLIRWRFAPLTRDAEQCLVEMAATCPAAQIKTFGRMIMEWKGVDDLLCPVFSIHGNRDRVIPLKCAEPDLILKNAGHAFTLTHVDQTNLAIREFLQTLPEQRPVLDAD